MLSRKTLRMVLIVMEWIWEDGVSSTYHNWLAQVFLSGSAIEDCAVINGEVAGVRETGGWNALECTLTEDAGAGLSHGYLCSYG